MELRYLRGACACFAGQFNGGIVPAGLISNDAQPMQCDRVVWSALENLLIQLLGLLEMTGPIVSSSGFDIFAQFCDVYVRMLHLIIISAGSCNYLDLAIGRLCEKNAAHPQTDRVFEGIYELAC